MPDLSNFKMVGEKMYCWDKYNKCFVEVILYPVTDKQVLATVMEAYLEEKDDQSKTPRVLC